MTFNRIAVMGEIPLVVVNVQRGGPSTGQPTKSEQGDLLTAMFGSHGDAPKVVMAPSVVTRPTRLLPGLVNHRFPSGPATIPAGNTTLAPEPSNIASLPRMFVR